MNEFNFAGGLRNREVGELLHDLYDLTVADKMEWDVTGSPKRDVERTHRGAIGAFSIRAEMQADSPVLMVMIGQENRLVAIVDDRFPPELEVRAKLAGQVFGLIKLLEG